MRSLLLGALSVVIAMPLAAVSAASLPARPMPAAEALRSLVEPVHGRILYGNSYRYASPYYSYGYPRLYYYPWGVAPRSYARHRRWRLR